MADFVGGRFSGATSLSQQLEVVCWDVSKEFRKINTVTVRECWRRESFARVRTLDYVRVFWQYVLRWFVEDEQEACDVEVRHET